MTALALFWPLTVIALACLILSLRDAMIELTVCALALTVPEGCELNRSET